MELADAGDCVPKTRVATKSATANPNISAAASATLFVKTGKGCRPSLGMDGYSILAVEFTWDFLALTDNELFKQIQAINCV
jgi:hypothetical protein